MQSRIQIRFVLLIALTIASVQASFGQVHSLPIDQAAGWQAVQHESHMAAEVQPRIDSKIVSASPVASENQQPKSEITYQRQSKRRSYLLDSGDTLGIFLEGVLGKLDSAPPVFYPPEGSSLGPSMGYPIVVRKNGTVSLPLVEPISVRGLTLIQAEDRIKSVFFGNNKTGQKILNENSRIIVTLQRKRTISVTVIRQDNSNSIYPSRQYQRGPVNSRSDKSARSSTIQLPADESNLLSALLETGGLPGLNAKPEARIYRAQSERIESRASFDGGGFPRTGGSAGLSSNVYRSPSSQQSRTFNVPMAVDYSALESRKTSLGNGDMVLVESKPTEVFYTSGLLRSAQHRFPRDKSLNVLEAIAIAGGTNTQGNNRLGFSQLQPTELNIIRNHPQYGQTTFRVDIERAKYDPSQRVLVVPGDHLILQYRPAEKIGNFGINSMNGYGLRRLFQ